MHRPWSWPLLALALTVVAGACGGDGDTSATPATTSTTAAAGGPATPSSVTIGPGGTTPTTRPGTPTTVLVEGPVLVDGAQVVVDASGGALAVTGQLPTPCHQLSYEVVAPDVPGGTVAVRLFSLVDPDVMCAQAVAPFTSSVPLGPVPGTPTPVTLNGDPVGTLG